MEAIVLAGGKGTRLRSVVGDLPKPLAPVNGLPFLEYLIRYLKRNGISSIVMSIGYMGEKIRSYGGDVFCGVAIKYQQEDSPLGTGGAIVKAMDLCQNNDIIVVNGDTFFDIDLPELVRFHKCQHADISISLKEMTCPDRYGTVEIAGNAVTAFREKQHISQGFINGGVYCIKRNLFENFTLPESFSFEREFLETRIMQLKICATPLSGNFIDIGIPKDYELAQSLLPQWMQL